MSTEPQKIRLAFFLPSLRGGGAERATLLIAKGLSERGYAVDLLVGKAIGPLLPRVPTGVRLISLDKKRVTHTLPKLLRYLREEKPAVIYSTIINANLVAIVATRLLRLLTRGSSSTRVVVRESNAPSLKSQDGKANRLLYSLVPRLYPLADAVIAVSEGVAAELRLLNPVLKKTTYVLPTPVVSEDLIKESFETPNHPWLRETEVEFPEIRAARSGLAEKIPVVLAVGRLHPQKDFPTLIKAFAKVRKDQLARLIILGEGSERASLVNLVKELHLSNDVSLPGYVDNPFCYMRKAAVFVLSSTYEGMPNVLIQAMACETPVVATDCKSGPREVLGNGNLGKLVPISAPDQLALAIKESLFARPNPEAASFASAKFGTQQAIEKYLSVGLGSLANTNLDS